MKPCLLCGKLTTGSIGAAGMVWDSICQPCKDSEDTMLKLQTDSLALGFRFVTNKVFGLGERDFGTKTRNPQKKITRADRHNFMANWKYRLSVGRDRRDYEDGLISLQELGKRFASKIKGLPCYGKDESMFSSVDELGDCALEFENVIDTEDFDNILESLYDWADTEIAPFGAWPRNKICWIEPPSAQGSEVHAGQGEVETLRKEEKLSRFE